MQVLVTGATGFIGRAVIQRLLEQGHRVVAATRRLEVASTDAKLRWERIAAVDAETEWMPVLAGVDAVIHLVALTHLTNEQGADAEHAYQRVNVDGTRRLAEQARSAGVKRFVFVSSVKAQAERGEQPLREDDPPCPEDAYGQTKLAAEVALSDALASSGTRYTIIRPPLVYGAGVKGNLRQLARATLSGWPLPFGRVDNRRSLMAVDNLADLLVQAAGHPAAADRVFLAADGTDLSTPELIRQIARAAGCEAHLLPVPPALVAWTLRRAGRQSMASKLLDSLRIDDSRVRQALDWAPPLSTDAALAAMAEELLARR